MSVQFSWLGPQVKAAVHAAAAAGLHKAAQHVLGEAIKIAPLDKGPLTQSGTATIDDDSLKAMVAFDTPYAARQHEELTWRHTDGRQAKYLEQPLFATVDDQRRIITTEIRKATRS